MIQTEDYKTWLAKRHKMKVGEKGHSKTYENKNCNVEYYYDANGDIKRRKLAR